MPPFEFQGYRSPYVGTIADLIQAPGRARAAGEMASGEAASRAAANIGATISAIPGQVANIREQNQKAAVTNVALKGATRASDALAAYTKILQETPLVEVDGMHLVDVATVTKKMAAGGFGPEAMDAASKTDEFNGTIQKQRAATLATAQSAADKLEAAHDDPKLAGIVLDIFDKNHIYPADQIQQMRDLIASDPTAVKRIREFLQTPRKPEYGKIGPGEIPTVNGQPTQATPPVPEKPTEVSLAIKAAQGDKDSIAAMAILKPQIDKGRQAEWGMLDGKAIAVAFDPKDGKRYNAAGEDITDRVKPMPPASVIVNQNAEAEYAKRPPQTGRRPDPAVGNVVDPLTGLSANTVYQDGITFALTAAAPNLGFGQNPGVRAGRNDIQNNAAAMATNAGTDFPTLRAEYNGLSATLRRLIPTTVATAGFAQTALDNLELAKEQSPKVDRTNSPMANRYIQWADGHNLTGNPELTKLETYIYTAAREYAKVTSGSALSAQGLTDSANREASKLLNAAQTPGAFDAAMTAMQNDMATVTRNQRAQIAGTSKTIANFLSAVTGDGPLTAPDALAGIPDPAKKPATTVPGGLTNPFAPKR